MMSPRQYWALYRTSGQTSADGQNDSFQGPAAEAGAQPRAEYGRRMPPWGLDSRMPAGGEMIAVCAYGNTGQALIVGGRSGAYPAPAIDIGETVLYSLAVGCKVYLDKNGNVAINAGASKNVVVNGGTLAVARETDPVASGNIETAVSIPVAGTTIVAMAYTPQGGAPTQLLEMTFVAGLLTTTIPAANAAPLVTPIEGVITDGALHFFGQ